jgi:hypothetical protein
VGLLGQAGFEIGSHYDRIKVAIKANLPPNASPVQTLLVIEPGAQVQGPVIELPIEVHEKRVVRFGSIFGGLFSLGLLVSASLVASTSWKAGLLSVGLLLAFALQSLGRPVGSLVGPAASGVHAPSPAPGAAASAADGRHRNPGRAQ